MRHFYPGGKVGRYLTAFIILFSMFSFIQKSFAPPPPGASVVGVDKRGNQVYLPDLEPFGKGRPICARPGDRLRIMACSSDWQSGVSCGVKGHQFYFYDGVTNHEWSGGPSAYFSDEGDFALLKLPLTLRTGAIFGASGGAQPDRIGLGDGADCIDVPSIRE